MLLTFYLVHVEDGVVFYIYFASLLARSKKKTVWRMEFNTGPIYFLKVISYRDEENFPYLVGRLCNVSEFVFVQLKIIATFFLVKLVIFYASI
jgi:hypothetical protein